MAEHEQERAHSATVEINRGMKGEYSIRVVARGESDMACRVRALSMLAATELDLGITSDWTIPFTERKTTDEDTNPSSANTPGA